MDQLILSRLDELVVSQGFFQWTVRLCLCEKEHNPFTHKDGNLLGNGP
jgi:hypothetical protein